LWNIYCFDGDTHQQSVEMGLIKFGSRMDLLIPLDAEVSVKLEEVVFGGKTVIAVGR